MLRRSMVAAALFAALALLLGAPAMAQEPDEDRLDELRAQIPEGFPGEYDLPEGEAIFQDYSGFTGDIAVVDDFGDGSVLTGPCGGFAVSYDSSGELLDAAIDAGDDSPPVDLLDGGQAFTSGNPFKVDTNGLVQYFGFMPLNGDGPVDHRWEVTTAGISLDSGGDPNPNLKNRSVGIVDLAEELPVKFNAKVRVEGRLDDLSPLAPCIGKGHVEFIATGITPALIGSIAALGGGVLGLLFNARPAMTYKA